MLDGRKANMKSSPFTALETKGFTIRPATMDDLEEAVDMFNRSSRKMIGRDEFTPDKYSCEWQAPGFDLERDSRVVLSNKNEIVGCVEVWSLLDPPVHPWVWARVDPKWEGQGIGSAMLQWGKARAVEATFDRVPDTYRIAMYCSTFGNHPASKQLLEEFGMQFIRQGYRMRIDLDEPIPEPVWPQGITLRPYHHAEDGEAVYRAHDEAFKDHWGYFETQFEQGYKNWQHFLVRQDHFDPSLWFIAVDGNEIAGVALCRVEAKDDAEIGWIDELGIRRPWRKKGLALALLQHAFIEYRRRGKGSVGLDVDAYSLTGATRLYERAGMYIERTQLIYELELRPGLEFATETL
jgi:mycothiol synthase